MRFLKSLRKVIDNDEVSFGEKLAERIAKASLKGQIMFATKINKAVGNMSTKRLRTLLVLFCFLLGGYSGWLIVKSVALTPKQDTVWQIEQMKRPAILDKPGDDSATADVFVDEYTYRQTQVFKMYMDSLRGANRRLFDSVLAARPRLMDSVLTLEKLYNLQNQK